MKLEIMSSQSETNPIDNFSKIVEENKVNIENDKYEHYICYPEAQAISGKHPKKIFEDVRRIVKKHIENDKDLFILTSSEYVLVAVRIEIKKHKFKGARCRYVLNNGEEDYADIMEDGTVTNWHDEIFDMMETGLYMLRKEK